MTNSVSTVNQRVAVSLAEAGAHTVFDVHGSASALTEELINCGLTRVQARGHAGAVAMATVYNRLTGHETIAVLNLGTGFDKAITEILVATRAASSLIIITNDDEPPVELAGALGANCMNIASPDEAPEVLNAALQALTTRSTVIVNIPDAIQFGTPPTEVATELGKHRTGTVPQISQVVRAAKSIQDAERPLILAGRGGLGARDQLLSLAEACGALLATSTSAHGLFAGADWNVGLCGTFSSPVAAKLISEADLVLSFGCALSDWTTKHGELISEEGVLIQIDTSPWAIGRFSSVSQTLVADAAAVAEALEAELPESHPVGYRTEEVAGLLSDKYWSPAKITDNSLDAGNLTAALDSLLPAERVVLTHAKLGYPVAYLTVPDEFGFDSLQTTEYGVATLIGALAAQPERLPVLCTLADGFFNSLAEMETLVNIGRPSLILVYNDTVTDIAQIASGFGAEAAVIDKRSDLEKITAWLPQASGPLVLDARVFAQNSTPASH